MLEDPGTLLFADLDGELKTTRRMLERVPDGQRTGATRKIEIARGTRPHIGAIAGLRIMM